MNTSTIEYFTAAEVARKANRAPATVLRRIHSGEIKPDTTLGRTMLFRAERLPLILQMLEAK